MTLLVCIHFELYFDLALFHALSHHRMNAGATSINYSADNDNIGIVQNPLFLETDPEDLSSTAASKQKQTEVYVAIRMYIILLESFYSKIFFLLVFHIFFVSHV